MACNKDPFGKMCPVHASDHTRFLNLMHHLEFTPCFPLQFNEIVENIPMYKCKHTWQGVILCWRPPMQDGMFLIGCMNCVCQI